MEYRVCEYDPESIDFGGKVMCLYSKAKVVLRLIELKNEGNKVLLTKEQVEDAISELNDTINSANISLQTLSSYSE